MAALRRHKPYHSEEDDRSLVSDEQELLLMLGRLDSKIDHIAQKQDSFEKHWDSIESRVNGIEQTQAGNSSMSSVVDRVRKLEESNAQAVGRRRTIWAGLGLAVAITSAGITAVTKYLLGM